MTKILFSLSLLVLGVLVADDENAVLAADGLERRNESVSKRIYLKYALQASDIKQRPGPIQGTGEIILYMIRITS